MRGAYYILKKFLINKIKIYLSIQYRLNRKRFFMAHIYLFAVCIILAALSLLISMPFSISADNGTDTLSAIVLLQSQLFISLGLILANYFSNLLSWSMLLFIASIFLTIGRLYDLNKSYAYLLLYALPIVNIVFFLYLCCKKGSSEPNKYGVPVIHISDNELLDTPGFYIEEPINTSYQTTLFEQVFSWRGRLNRQRYLLRNIGLLGMCVLVFTGISVTFMLFIGMSVAVKAVADIPTISLSISTIGFIFTTVFVMFFITVLLMIIPALWKIRRWHDLGHSGFYLLLTELPYFLIVCGLPDFTEESASGYGIAALVLIILLILWLLCVNLYLLLIKGTTGENVYGKDPLSDNNTPIK